MKGRKEEGKEKKERKAGEGRERGKVRGERGRSEGREKGGGGHGKRDGYLHNLLVDLSNLQIHLPNLHMTY
jgi:hypothetical protein